MCNEQWITVSELPAWSLSNRIWFSFNGSYRYGNRRESEAGILDCSDFRKLSDDTEAIGCSGLTGVVDMSCREDSSRDQN